jgi:transketolase
MTVIVPSDPIAVEKLLPQVAAWEGPVYFRLNRNPVPVLFDSDYQPVIGKAIQLAEGNDVCLIATGMGVSRCLAAAQILRSEGIDVQVLEIHSLKPLDKESILLAAEKTGALVTVEEHSIIGGLGGAVAEATSSEFPVPVIRVGIADQFAETGPYEALLDRYGLAIDHIINSAKKAIMLKESRIKLG